MNLTEKIKKRRNKLNMSFDELALKAGISKGHLSGLEDGKNTNPTLKTIYKLATALAVNPKSLV